jgi:hypothetical protein
VKVRVQLALGSEFRLSDVGMILRVISSKWIGTLLLVAMIVSVTLGVHSDRAPTSRESVLAYASMAAVLAWLGLVAIRELSISRSKQR